MDPVTMILTALSAGAASGAASAMQDDARAAVTAAHERLRRLVRKHVAGDTAAETALVRYEADPQASAAPLAAKLAELGAAEDTEMLSAAETLLALVRDADKYRISIRDSKGIQVGERNVQINRFND